MFFKKEINILFENRVYNYIINFKEEFFSLSFVLYNISCNKIQELRRYLNKNFIKNFIRINRS